MSLPQQLQQHQQQQQQQHQPPPTLPPTLWSRKIALHITHPSCPSQPAFISLLPRHSYLSLLLPRLSCYFGPSLPCSAFFHEGIQLRNLPLGLLADLYRAPQPWHLEVDLGPDWDIGDTFLNSAKEADFVRNGNAKRIMSLSEADTKALWEGVRDDDFSTFTRINNHLLNAPTPLKHVPVRLYIPSSSPSAKTDATSQPEAAKIASFKVMQALVKPRLANRTQQTLGSALKSLLPALFPSSRDPVFASIMLHGAAVPFRAPVEELLREAAYPDGWLYLIVVVL